jgi:hypothetical protein
MIYNFLHTLPIDTTKSFIQKLRSEHNTMCKFSKDFLWFPIKIHSEFIRFGKGLTAKRDWLTHEYWRLQFKFFDTNMHFLFPHSHEIMLTTTSDIMANRLFLPYTLHGIEIENNDMTTFIVQLENNANPQLLNL